MTIEEGRERLRRASRYLSNEEYLGVEAAAETAIRAHAGQERSDGSPYATHALAVGTVLAEWRADAATIAAGILHDTVEDTAVALADITGTFGKTVAVLVDGVTKLTEEDIAGETSLDGKIETLRKLFDVMRQDIRVVLIKLADRLHNVRTMAALPQERRPRFAQETLDIYAKLAYHLGMNDLRREFAERCLPLLAPAEVEELRRVRDLARAEGKRLLEQMQPQLRAADAEGALLSLHMHPRSLASLLRERQETGGIKQGFVIIAIGKDRDSCYALLKLFHTLYRPVSGEFHDYIAAPSENAYQSIRAMVFGPGNELIPLRIRTAGMDEQERLGVLLWCFGHRRKNLPGFSWLRRSESLDQATRESSDAFFQALQSDILQETVNIIVDGKDVHLPRQATVLDALYARHGHNTHRTGGVRVNGASAALADPLAEDAVIQTTFATGPHVSFDWLGFIATAYARQCIVAALQERDRSEKLALGQRLLQKELDHHQQGALADVSRLRLRETAAHFRRDEFEEVLTLIGEGVLPARDVVISLFPEQRKGIPFFQGRKTSPHHFRIHLTGTHEKTQDILPKLHALARLGEVAIGKTDLRVHHRAKIFDLFVSGTTSDRLHFGDFLTSLERQSWISHVRALISLRQKEWLVASFSLAFGIVLLDLLLLPRYATWFREFQFFPAAMLQALPLLPIFAVNSYLLRLLRHHVVRMRTDRWFVGVGFVLNVIGLLATIGAGIATGGQTHGLLPIVALFLLSMMYLGFRFFQTEALFQTTDQKTLRPLTKEEWQGLKRKKMVGYAIRFGAVIIWGVQPLYLRYTPANDVDPLVRVFLMSVGILLVSFLLVGIRYAFEVIGRGKPSLSFKIPWNRELLSIVVGAALFTYFLNASLRLTTSTNFILFNNFSPIFALLVAAVFWRQTIPYLKRAKHILWVFLIFLMGSTGSTLIIYNSVLLPRPGPLYGDVLALLAAAADIVYVIGQIRYIKVVPKVFGPLLNIHVFSCLTLTTLPVLLFLFFSRSPILLSLTFLPVLYAVGAGVLSGMGQLLNYEAFRRIDGFIAFLMFNISILITFMVEVFVLGKFVPTWVLLIGGITIVSSSILAEFINSRCEKRGL